MEYKYKTRFCPLLETESIRFPKVSYGLPPCSVCPTTGVPVPSNIVVSPDIRSATITFNFNFRMNGEDHFLITILDANENNAVFTLRFQPSNAYVIPSLVNGTPYYATIVPVINGIQYRPGISSVFVPSTGIPGDLIGLTLVGGSGQASFTYSSILPSIPTANYISVAYDTEDIFTVGSPFTVSNLTNGSSYTFEVRTLIYPDKYGPSRFFNNYIPGPPDTPSTLIYGGNGEAYIYVTVDTIEHPAPQYYHVSISGTLSSQQLTDQGGYITYTGLTNTCEYSFYVRSYANGFFSPSVGTGSIYVGAPGPPSNISGSPGDGIVSLYWNPPTLGASIIDGYQISNNIIGNVYTTTNLTSFVIPDLINGTPYTFDIRSYGNELYSLPVTSPPITPGPVTVNPPTNLRLSMSNVTATLTFSAAIGPVDYYEITNGAGSNVSAASSPIVFNGLTNGSQYVFSAYSWNGSISSSVVNVGPTYAGMPTAPINLTFNPSYTQIQLNWVRGVGIPPQYYQISNITTGSVSNRIVTTYTQTNLSRGRSYLYTVRGFANQVFGPSANIVASTLSPPVPDIWYPDAGPESFATIGTCVASDKNSNWVAGGGSGAVTLLFSSNGSNWSNATNGFTTFARGVATDTFGRWIATGQDTGGKTIKYSTDNGSNWTNSATGMFTSAENGWCVATDKLGRWFVGGASSGSTIRYSTNGGSNWLNVTSGWFVGACRGIATNGTGTWVAVGNNLDGKSIKYSTDNGLNWSNSPTVPTFNDTGLGIAYKNGVWVATGRHILSGRTILYSTDGITWSPTIGDFTNIGFAVAVDNNGVWVAGGSNSSPGNTIKYSFNGINWSNVALGSFTGPCLGVDVNNAGLWVGAGSNPTTLRYSIAT